MLLAFVATLFIIALLTAYLILAIAPKPVMRVGAQAARNPFFSGFVGLGAITVGPLVFLLLLITLIGILLVPLALMVSMWVGMTAVYCVIGQKIRRAFRTPKYRAMQLLKQRQVSMEKTGACPVLLTLQSFLPAIVNLRFPRQIK